MLELMDNITKQLELWQASTKKSPIAYLKEKCEVSKILTVYEELDTDCAVKTHPRLYRFRVSVQDKTAEGAGTSKKKACKAAALKMILDMEGLPLEEVLLKHCNTSQPIPSEREIRYNPIGDLDRLAAKLFLPPPIYNQSTRCITSDSDQHKRYSHVCTITINDHIVTGESTERKKEAKRKAAELMLSVLKSVYHLDSANDMHRSTETTPHLSSAQHDPITDESLRQSTVSINISDQPQTVTYPRTSPTYSKLPSNWSELVRKAELYSELCCSTTDNDDSESRLRALVEVDFLDIAAPNINGLHQCLVRLLTTPIIILQGSSDTLGGARQAAAKRALEYLKDNLKIGQSMLRTVSSS